MDRTSNLLDEALGLDERAGVMAPGGGRVVLIEDSVETSAAFVLHHLMKRALSLHTSGVVLFVAFAQPFSHYERILRKLGCNLVSQRDSNRFFFFDMLKLEYQGGFVELYRKIQKAVEDGIPSESQRNCITVMVDDVSLMEAAANGNSSHVLDFLHYCHTLTSELGCSLVTLNHQDVYSSADGPTLILEMEYLADAVVKVEPLVTGLATDVHGQLTVLNKGVVDEHGCLSNKLQNFHFKVKENGVDYFYPGSRT